MTQDQHKLEPCPFCGGPVSLERATETYEHIHGRRQWWGVVCRNTENLGGTCAIYQRPSASPEAAIERWNTRAPLQQRPLPVREGADEPIAWRVRGYNQFKTSAPGPWRYFDGPTKPRVNIPSDCDFEPLFASSPSLPVREEPTPVLNALQVLERMDYRPGDRVLVEHFLSVLWARGMWVIESPLASSPSVQNMGEGETGKDGVDVPLAPSTKPMPFDEAAVHTLAIRHGVGGKLSDLCAFARGVLDAHGCGVKVGEAAPDRCHAALMGGDKCAHFCGATQCNAGVAIPLNGQEDRDA